MVSLHVAGKSNCFSRTFLTLRQAESVFNLYVCLVLNGVSRKLLYFGHPSADWKNEKTTEGFCSNSLSKSTKNKRNRWSHTTCLILKIDYFYDSLKWIQLSNGGFVRNSSGLVLSHKLKCLFFLLRLDPQNVFHSHCWDLRGQCNALRILDSVTYWCNVMQYFDFVVLYHIVVFWFWAKYTKRLICVQHTDGD